MIALAFGIAQAGSDSASELRHIVLLMSTLFPSLLTSMACSRGEPIS
jgi:hypothetical protein